MSFCKIMVGENESSNAQAQAALIVFEVIRPKILENREKPKELEKIIEPIFGFHWTKELIIKVGSKPINDFLNCIKSTTMVRPRQNTLRKIFNSAYYDQTEIFPAKWEIWKDLITRYHLFEIVPFASWAKLLFRVESLRINTPLDLGELSQTEALTIDTAQEAKGNIILLWQACLCWKENNPKGSSDIRDRLSEDVHKMLLSLRVDNLCETKYFKEWIRLREVIGLDESYNDLMPNARVRALANAKVDKGVIEDFLRLGVEINHLRSVAGSLRCVSSGIHSYISFCVLTGRPFLPATEDSVLLWGSSFKPGRTFRNYLSHLRKGCLVFNSPLDWDTAAVRSVAKGLRSAHRIPFKFPNFLYTQDIFTIINTIGWQSEFAQLCFISFLFSLRVPSEALLMLRAYSDDPIEKFVPQADKVLIGTRSWRGIDCLIVKMSWRKNLSGGCILRRPCLCGDKNPRAQKICPPHRVWPLLAERVSSGERVFPSFRKNNVNQLLKLNLRILGFSDGHLYTSKAFRRGSTQELHQSGNSLEVIKGAGGWHGAGFKSYIDHEIDSSFRISRLLVALSDGDSSEEEGKKESTKADAKRRRIWRAKTAKGDLSPPEDESLSPSLSP